MHAYAVSRRGPQADGRLQAVQPETVAIGVVVAEWVTGSQCRDTVAALSRQAQAVVDGAHGTARPQRGLARSMAPHGKPRLRLRFAAALARDQVDDTAHRIRAIEAGAGAAQHLDALQLRQPQGLDRRKTQRGRSHAHAVDQHHRLLRRRATDEEAAALPRPAVARDLQPGFATQQVGQRVGRGEAQRVGVDHRHIGGQALHWQGLT